MIFSRKLRDFILTFLLMLNSSLSMGLKVYARDEGQIFTKATEVYGPLVIREGNFNVESPLKPWSSWWYPYRDKVLFSEEGDAPSTLERYDQFVINLTGENPSSSSYEKQYIYDPQAPRWVGRCDAWALASIIVPEPTKAITLEGVTFRVRDLKGLIIKSFEQVEGLMHFGQRYDGHWDSVYEDIYPDQFHRFLQAELFEKKLPFIMDHDAGIEVWTSPIWKAHTKIIADEIDAKVFHVKTWLFGADYNIQDLDYVGTEGPIIYTYTYDLFGERLSNGLLLVSSGKWTDSSRWDHPDYLIPNPQGLIGLKNRSFNEGIKNSFIEMILKGER